MAYQFQVDNAGTLMSGLQAYYKYDGNSNDTLGSINGTDTSIDYDAAVINNGALFNSATDLISFGNNFNLTTGPVAVATWVRYTTSIAGKYPAIFAKSDYDGVSDWEVRWVNGGGQINFGFYDSGGNVDQCTTAIDYKDNGWHHIVAQRDGTNLKIYVDTVERASATDNLRNVSNSLSAVIGLVSGHGYSEYRCDEMGIWNKALSSQERTDLYNSGAGNTLITASGGGTVTASTKNNLLLIGVG